MPRRKSSMLVAAGLFAIAVVLFLRSGARPVESEVVPRPAIAGVETNLARIEVDSAANALEVIIGPVFLPAHTEGLRTPIQLVELPIGGSLHGYSWRITDGSGRELSSDLLHHVNLIDPDRRELFSTTARRLLAAGRETQEQSFSSLVGYPLRKGTRLLVVAMLANDGATPVADAYLRVRLAYSKDGPLEPLTIFPFGMDVMGPVGEKSFPVPPGRTERSWEGSPAVDARILAIGGHLHDHGTALRLEDVTTGEVLWEAEPVMENGRLISIPVTMTWKKGGIRLRRDHRYRITAVYENPTDQPALHGGMGVIAGIAHVRSSWPPLRPDDADYRQDLELVISAPHRAAGQGHAHMH